MRGTCWIKREALAVLLAEARRWPLRETGGALLGWRDEKSALVIAVLGPGPEASHGYSHFEPDGEWQQREGERHYRESGRTVAYLGDWHSHPHGGPYPSRQDRQTARMVAEDEAFRAPQPLYAIASKRWYELRNPSWRLKVLEWHEGRLQEMELRVLSTADDKGTGLRVIPRP
jgi:integrative and conjugative element protein (TIGR02256 family)